MSFLISPAVRALGLTIVCAAVAGAQAAPQKECSVNEGRPTQVGRATLAVQVASSAIDPSAAARQLTSAVKTLTANAEKMDNQVGRNFVLGKALVLWTLQPNVELTTKRGPLGYTTNPTEMIDLVAAIDTAFKMVETANPECISETSRWRGQKAWIGLVNKAIERLNADDSDAAETSARRAILLNPYAPYGYVILANVMQKRSRSTEAFGLYRQSIEVAARDTAYDEVRRQSLIYLGGLAADSAELTPDAAARKPYVETARTAFETILQDKGAGEFAANARAGMCRVAIVSGDTASLRVTYKEALTAPAGLVYSDLMNVGVCLARAEMIPEATTLFQAAYEKNSYHRDALSNLAIMLLRSDRHEQSLALANRLASVEPNNPENLQLLVAGYAGIAKRIRDVRMAARPATPARGGARPAGTKTAPAAPKLSAAASDSLFKLEAAYSDSAAKAYEKRENLAYRVQLSDFSTSEEKATIAGIVTNQGTTAKPIIVRVDFLDRSGKVVSTKEADLGTIAAGASARFNVTATPGKEIAAFKYSPIE